MILHSSNLPGIIKLNNVMFFVDDFLQTNRLLIMAQIGGKSREGNDAGYKIQDAG